MKENDGFKCARFNRFVKELGADKDSPRDKGKSFGAHLSNLKELERSAAEGDCPFCFRCKSAKKRCKSTALKKLPSESYRKFFTEEQSVSGKYLPGINSRSVAALHSLPD